MLNAAAAGGTAADIAGRLHLSEGTVRNHLSSAIGKTGARTGQRPSGSPIKNGGCLADRVLPIAKRATAPNASVGSRATSVGSRGGSGPGRRWLPWMCDWPAVALRSSACSATSRLLPTPGSSRSTASRPRMRDSR